MVWPGFRPIRMRSTDMTSTTTDFDVTVVSLPRDLGKVPLVEAFMRFRKRVFVDRMEWQLVHAEGIEFEQYDSFKTTYIIAHQGNEVLGGARLKRTDSTFGSGILVYSYMIRDAHLGLLPNMPCQLCTTNPPVDSNIWELTRFVAAEKPHGVAEAILRKANAFLFEQQAQSCLFLGPPAFLRMAKRLGWSAEPLGPVVGNDDGRFLAFSCAVLEPKHRNNNSPS